jgi:bifunctional UDP-N-acetylglucosamine pyrophosphorylase/glucosamine-1-phosphate N-acetyltransferase
MQSPLRDLAVLVLAAGKGTRMRSRVAKVLHPICGKPMLNYPLAAAESLSPSKLVCVIGRDADTVREAFRGRAEFVLQAEQRGTGHAVLQCRDALRNFEGDVLILYGDGPLLRGETLRRMRELKASSGADLVMLSAEVDVPGIVIRNAQGQVARIVEATDATPAELAIRERNTGVYLLDAGLLWKTLDRVGDDNAQREIYLTTIVELAVADGYRVEALRLADAEEAMGVNTRVELARAALGLRRRINDAHMRNGVSIVDPDTTYIDDGVEIGADTLIEPGVVIQGPCAIGSGVHIKPHCVIESSRLGDGVVIGPCAHLRPNSALGENVRIGNFVEVKNSTFGAGVKADHLSYIGDADVGAGASFGCGTIVVNYDGIDKHRTTVGENAFVGCNSNLVAPITLERDSFVAAGSTLTQDVPADALAVARARQRNVEGWVARRNANKKKGAKAGHDH